MNINVSDYLSDAQMHEIAVETWRDMCRAACNGNAERIIGNIAYNVVCQMVVEALGDDANEQIKAKALDAIDNLSPFLVFKRPDAWDRGPTPAFNALMDAVKCNKDLIDKKVREAISQISKRDALEIIKSGVVQINPARSA